MHHAEHAPLCFRPPLRLIDSDAMDCGDRIVIDRPERRDKAGDELGASGVLVAPWAPGMEPQYMTSNFLGQNESTRSKIVFGCGLEWRSAFVPNLSGAFDANYVIFGTAAIFTLTIGGTEIPFIKMLRRDCALLVPVVTGFPSGEAETLAHIISTFSPIVPAMRMYQEAIWSVGL
jgi:hypothetical protein